LPIEGVQVGLVSPALEKPLTVVTDAGGVFAFLKLPAGSYHLLTQKVGFRPYEKPNIRLADDETLELTVQLRALPAAVPHQDGQFWRGIVSGWKVEHPADNTAQTGGQLPPPFKFKNLYSWNTTDDPGAINAVVVELFWQSNQPFTEDLFLKVYVTGFNNENDPNRIFGTVEARSPIKLVITQERIHQVLGASTACALDNHPDRPFCRMSAVIWPGTGNTAAPVDFGLAADQGFELAITTFYRIEPDADYTYFA
jgi:hypothetical protein